VVVFDLEVLFVFDIDRNEVQKEHKLIVDEIVLIQKHRCKTDTKNMAEIGKF